MPVVKRKEIRERRRRLGMKLGQFAEFAGVKYMTLANVECGHQNPSIEVVHRIANAFQCDAEELLGEDEPDTAKTAA